MEDVKSAVVVRHAYKRYGKGPDILKDFNMTIPKNYIYGLLGSSGCGKTTLLKCLVGALDLDYGSIELIVNSKKKIGFMPQETALFDEFTIAETFQFYASLYRISSEEFRAKMKELQEVLDLPPDHRTCSTLSGGQVRRVSIAVTLLHTPSLVILDEPTSGLDPMLAHYFWQYLQRMSSNGQTIIITTHYIEEARQANVVGLMRKGVLLAEKSPEELIASYGVESLEEVFLRLCHQQNQAIEAEPEKKIPFKNPYKDDVNTYTMFWPHTKAIIYKNFKWVQRNFTMFILLSVGLSVACMFESNECLKYAPQMRVGVVNHGAANCSNYAADPDYSCGDNQTVDFSCNFVEAWRAQVPDFPVILYDDMSEAMRFAKSRYLVSVLEFPANFTLGILQRFTEGSHVEQDLLDNSAVDIRQDSTDFMATYQIEQNIRDIMGVILKDYLRSCGYNPKVADIPPMNINKEAITFLAPTILLTLSLCLEKVTGAYTRCIVSGVRVIEILAGYTIVLVLYNLINIAAMSLVQFVIYGQPYGNFWLSYVLINFIGFTGIFFGFFVVILTRSLIESAGLCIIMSVSSYTFTGFIWPIEAAVFPQVRYISTAVLPNTLVLKSFMAIVWKDASFWNKQVYLGFMICILHTIFYISIIYLMLRYKKAL
ncbi:hypothetical protein M8J76_013190 [Diaphorina citri]|nr:hypothetical protein M8J76_013190 [Diaphorina citri]